MSLDFLYYCILGSLLLRANHSTHHLIKEKDLGWGKLPESSSLRRRILTLVWATVMAY